MAAAMSGTGTFQPIQQVAQNPLGHAPDDPVLGDECRGNPRRTSNFDDDPVTPLLLQIRHREPDRGRNLFVQAKTGPPTKSKNERPNRDRREYRRSGNDIRQDTKERLTRQLGTDLLGGLSNRGDDEIVITGLATPTREGHVPRPGITLPVRPPDDEHCVRTGSQNQRDRGPVQPGLIGEDRKRRAEPPGEESFERQWECERQPPPQHPPAAGAG